jgi:glycosyltransferase involved in cell wall biosynthesis
MPRLLFITHTPPWPTNNGGNQRSNLLLRALSQCAKTDLLLLPRKPGKNLSQETINYLKKEFNLLECIQTWRRGIYWPWGLIRPFGPTFVDRCAYRLGSVKDNYSPDLDVSRWLANRLKDRHYDLIVGRYLQPTARSGALNYRPVVLDVDDFDTDVYTTRLKATGYSKIYRLYINRLAKNLLKIMPELLKHCDRIWVVKKEDQKRIKGEKAIILSNIPFIDNRKKIRKASNFNSNSETILSVGSLDYIVNVKAVNHFINKIWPTITNRFPAAKFRIIGNGLAGHQKRRWNKVKGVEAIGYVNELQKEYENAAFSISPIFEGGGTKIKVLESLMHKRTCVVSPHSLKGFEHILHHLESIWEAKDENEFAEGCIYLLKNKELRDSFAETGCNLVNKFFTFEHFRKVVENTIEELLVLSNGVVQRYKKNN